MRCNVLISLLSVRLESTHSIKVSLKLDKKHVETQVACPQDLHDLIIQIRMGKGTNKAIQHLSCLLGSLVFADEVGQLLRTLISPPKQKSNNESMLSAAEFIFLNITDHGVRSQHTLQEALGQCHMHTQQHTTATSRIGENIHMPPSTFCQHSNMPKIATTLLDIHPACKLLHNFQYPPARYSTWKHCPCLFLSPN